MEAPYSVQAATSSATTKSIDAAEEHAGSSALVFQKNTAVEYASFSTQRSEAAPERWQKIAKRPCPSLQHEIVVRSLGHFSVIIRGEALATNNRSYSKPLELLRVLIALGGRSVGETKLSEFLWPEAEGDVAHSAFSVTLHRLRKLLGHQALDLVDGRLTLNSDVSYVDVWDLENTIGTIKNILHKPLIDHQTVLSLIEHAFDIYQGHFLAHEDETAWGIPQTQRLQSKLMNVLQHACNYLELIQRCDIAVEIYKKAVEIDPFAEDFYYRLIKCYCKHDRKAEAKAIYQRCEKLFFVALELPLSQKMRQLYDSQLSITST
jgi:two-component SAPR family response regulator